MSQVTPAALAYAATATPQHFPSPLLLKMFHESQNTRIVCYESAERCPKCARCAADNVSRQISLLDALTRLALHWTRLEW